MYDDWLVHGFVKLQCNVVNCEAEFFFGQRTLSTHQETPQVRQTASVDKDVINNQIVMKLK